VVLYFEPYFFKESPLFKYFQLNCVTGVKPRSNKFLPFKLSMQIKYLLSRICSQKATKRDRLLNPPNFFYHPAFLLLAAILIFCSCNSTKNTIYFQHIPNDTTLSSLVSKDFEPKIQKGDLLGITVASLSPENTLIYNAPQDAQGPLLGYLVDENGDIQFVKIGTLHVAGITRKELKAALEKDLSTYLAQPVVAVGFLNRHITVIGGISPQIIPMPNDNMTILDALAASGGTEAKGRPDNILVVREKGNSKEFKRLNLTDSTIFYSPYFYMQPNDIVYVEPVKVNDYTWLKIYSLVITTITFIFFIINETK
jgi:polysaccharide biosynthesis/export protein